MCFLTLKSDSLVLNQHSKVVFSGIETILLRVQSILLDVASLHVVVV